MSDRDRIRELEDTAAALGATIVERNLEIGRLRDRLAVRRDQLARRAEAIGAKLAGQDGTEGVIDAAGVWHDLPGGDELAGIESVLTKLEASKALAFLTDTDVEALLELRDTLINVRGWPDDDRRLAPVLKIIKALGGRARP